MPVIPARTALAAIVLEPIGIIHTPHREQAGTPIQPAFAQGVRGSVTIFARYVEALADLDGFERIWLLYHLDRAPVWKSKVVPYLDTVERGLFATRSPPRPNPIGMSAVRLLAVDGDELRIEDVDILDGTPLLDIKPYVPQFDAYSGARAGWFDGSTSRAGIADGRFSDGGRRREPTD
jgi:tRNA-Thr(GGU) m(6)t(6)A37 methyltransferase TsaA